MKDKKENTELLEWLKRLKNYARDNGLSTRIRDGIDDCIRMTEMRSPDVEEIKASVEELLESIGNKVMSPAEKKAEEENGISIEDIRKQIAAMAKRCQTENVESLQNIDERKRAIIQKTYCELQEITHCEAHISELKSNNKYLGFYEQIKTSYEKQAMYVFKEFLSDLANNYQFMIDHMRSMFHSIGGEQGGFGSRRFYEEHDIKREQISRKLEIIAENADCGKSDIEELGNITKKKVQRIVQKNVIKMRFYILLPVLIIFLLLGVGMVWEYTLPGNIQDNVIQEQELEAKENAGLLDEVMDRAEDVIVDEAMKEIKRIGIRGIFESIIVPWLAAAGAVAVFIVLLIIVIYAAYIMLMKRSCDRRICEKCSEYLQTEWSQFKQKNALLHKMDTALNNLQEEYNRQYLVLLNHLFSKTDYNIVDAGNKDAFDVLKEEWTALKNR